MQQQPDHLHCLSQAHVIGQASPQPQPRDELQPAHARLLIGPKLARSPGGSTLASESGAAQLLERFFEGGAGGQSDPLLLLAGR